MHSVASLITFLTHHVAQVILKHMLYHSVEKVCAPFGHSLNFERLSCILIA